MRAVWRRLMPIWVLLQLLLLASLGAAYLGLGRYGTAASLGIAAVQAALSMIIFMQLRRPEPLLRLTASAGFLFLSFLFLLSFADLLTRPAATQPGTVTPRILAPVVGPTGRPAF